MGPSWGGLEGSWGHLGWSWGILGASWGGLGRTGTSDGRNSEGKNGKKAFEPPDHPADEGRKGRNPEVEKVKKPFEPLLLNRRQSLRTILGWSWWILGLSWDGLE